MAKKLFVLIIFAFILGILAGNFQQIQNTHNKKCFVKVNACAKNGICGPQIAKVC